jgi:ferredoxin-nitrate reductase
MVSLPDLHRVKAGLEKAELVVTNEAYHPTETSRLADVVFPVAAWGERSWTSTNSERMVTRSPKLWDAPGEALADYEIINRFAAKMGFGESFNYADNSQIWDEFIRLTKGRPCDMYGITSSRLNDGVSLQWPCPDAYHYGTKRRYTDHQFPTPTKKANFICREHKNPAEITSDEYPFVLTTGRIYAHWHTLTRTGKVEKLMARDPAPYVEVSPQDAVQLKLNEGDALQLDTRRGSIQLPVRIKETLPKGTVFVPFHWGDLYGEGNALNYLTIPAFGAVEKQPELKFCAVQLTKVTPDMRAQGVVSQRRPLQLLETVS